MKATQQMRSVLCFVGFGIVALAALTVGQHGGIAQDKKDPNREWVDYDDLDQTERLKERPGNYQILGAISEFYDAMYRVRPDYSRCAFPFYEDSKRFNNLEEIHKWWDDWAKDRAVARNKLRQFNIEIKSFSAYDPDEVSKSPQLLKKLPHKTDQERFAKVRKDHPGRAVLVLLKEELRSLQSKKIEEGDGILYLVHSGGRWKVAWHHPG
ncbi:MAG TPA: hypothetical protein VKI65_16070 [Gemmataceae bacterium]|nr:hypothetical protein [Gemmataceae bacterium]